MGGIIARKSPSQLSILDITQILAEHNSSWVLATPEEKVIMRLDNQILQNNFPAEIKFDGNLIVLLPTMNQQYFATRALLRPVQKVDAIW